MKNLKLPFDDPRIENYNPVFFDVETQFLSNEVEGGWDAIDKFKLSVGVTDTASDGLIVWQEQDAGRMIKYMEGMNPVVSYNGEGFDFKVLSAYGDVSKLYTQSKDILKIIKPILGYRLHLESIAAATLNQKKTADGFKAVEWWRSGDPELQQKVIDYCKSDVIILRKVYEFAKQNSFLYYMDHGSKRRFSIIL